ncbi:hypothetical protein [Streptomyces sp. NPDC002851]
MGTRVMAAMVAAILAGGGTMVACGGGGGESGGDRAVVTEADMRAWAENFVEHPAAVAAEEIFEGDTSEVCDEGEGGAEAVQDIIDDAPDSPYANAELEKALASLRDAIKGACAVESGDISQASEAFGKLGDAVEQFDAFAEKVDKKFPGLKFREDFDIGLQDNGGSEATEESPPPTEGSPDSIFDDGRDDVTLKSCRIGDPYGLGNSYAIADLSIKNGSSQVSDYSVRVEVTDAKTGDRRATMFAFAGKVAPGQTVDTGNGDGEEDVNSNPTEITGTIKCSVLSADRTESSE